MSVKKSLISLKTGMAALLLAALFSSCATYHQQMLDIQTGIVKENYALANKRLDNTRFFNKRKNELLYYLEKGRILFLQGKAKESNQYLNKADQLMGDFDNLNDDVKNTIKSLLYSSAESVYSGESFEKTLIHYYKALNYISLNNMEDALVEARRISLKLQEQDDKKKRGYQSDAFALILQGIVYEKAGEANNAFISYRNAYELYTKDDNAGYYGAPMPDDLKYSLIRTAKLSGFQSEAKYYSDKFGVKAGSADRPYGELIVFWDNGLGPVKMEQSYFFTLVDRNGGYFFHNSALGLDVPFTSYSGNSSLDVSDFNLTRIALPYYSNRIARYQNAFVKVDSSSYPLQLVENIDFIAQKTLKERMLKELGLILGRLAIKKVAEYELSKENETAGAILSLINAATEKADTRNWQSIPSKIYFVRIPLHQGSNKVTFTTVDGTGNEAKQSFTVEANGGLQIRHFNTPEIAVPQFQR